MISRRNKQRAKKANQASLLSVGDNCQTLISVQKVVRAGNIVVQDEKNPHIRTLETFEMDSDQAGREQWCVHNGHVDLSRRNRSSFQLAGTVSGQAAFDKAGSIVQR